jgi:hypothetical protein
LIKRKLILPIYKSIHKLLTGRGLKKYSIVQSINNYFRKKIWVTYVDDVQGNKMYLLKGGGDSIQISTLGIFEPFETEILKKEIKRGDFVVDIGASIGYYTLLFAKWTGTKDAIKLAGKRYFKDKIVIDVTNPLLFEKEGIVPKLALSYPKSAGLAVQKWLPKSKVVKAFNTVTAFCMANPILKEGKPVMFFAGNDNEAKKTVIDLAANWGWDTADMGDINNAYILEAIAMAWITYGSLNNKWTHAFKLLRE